MARKPDNMATRESTLKQALASMPYAQTLGVEPIFMGKEFTLKMPFIDSNIGNPTLPALHGGGIGGFMEITAIAQLLLSEHIDASDLSLQTLTNIPKPIGINIDYLRRGRPVDSFARAVLFKKGSRVVNVRVQAWQSDFDSPIAALHGHFLIPTDSTADTA